MVSIPLQGSWIPTHSISTSLLLSFSTELSPCFLKRHSNNPFSFFSSWSCAVILIGISLDWFLCCCSQTLRSRGLVLIYPQSPSGAAFGSGVSLIKSLHTHALITHALSLKHSQINAEKKRNCYASHSLPLTHPCALIIHASTQHFCSHTSHCMHLILLLLTEMCTHMAALKVAESTGKAFWNVGNFYKAFSFCPFFFLTMYTAVLLTSVLMLTL